MDRGIYLGAAAFAITASVLAIPSISRSQPVHAMGETMTRAQAESQIAERFATADADGDGRVTRAEADAHHAARRARHHGGERPEFAEERSMRARLTPEEMAPLTGNRAAPPETEHAAHHAGAAGESSRGHRRGMDHAMMFEAADANSDGALTLAEMTAHALAMFDRADADSDGIVTPEERLAAHRAMRASHHGDPAN